jgi:hypothetical protein
MPVAAPPGRPVLPVAGPARPALSVAAPPERRLSDTHPWTACQGPGLIREMEPAVVSVGDRTLGPSNGVRPDTEPRVVP